MIFIYTTVYIQFTIRISKIGLYIPGIAASVYTGTSIYFDIMFFIYYVVKLYIMLYIVVVYTLLHIYTELFL